MHLDSLYILPLCIAKSEIPDNGDTLQKDTEWLGLGLILLATLERGQNSGHCLSTKLSVRLGI